MEWHIIYWISKILILWLFNCCHVWSWILRCSFCNKTFQPILTYIIDISLFFFGLEFYTILFETLIGFDVVSLSSIFWSQIKQYFQLEYLLILDSFTWLAHGGLLSFGSYLFKFLESLIDSW